MKKISELGISPAPWTNEHGEVVASDGQTLFEAMLDNDDANARLIAAALAKAAGEEDNNDNHSL